jgi:hypothetical protein
MNTKIIKLSDKILGTFRRVENIVPLCGQTQNK